MRCTLCTGVLVRPSRQLHLQLISHSGCWWYICLQVIVMNILKAVCLPLHLWWKVQSNFLTCHFLTVAVWLSHFNWTSGFPWCFTAWSKKRLSQMLRYLCFIVWRKHVMQRRSREYVMCRWCGLWVNESKYSVVSFESSSHKGRIVGYRNGSIHTCSVVMLSFKTWSVYKFLIDVHHGFFLMGLKGNAEAYKWNECLVVRV